MLTYHCYFNVQSLSRSVVVDNLAGEASPCLHYLREFCTVQVLDRIVECPNFRGYNLIGMQSIPE